MKAAVFEAPGHVVITDLPEPEVGARDVLVRVEVAGICGSDVTTFSTGAYGTAGQVLGHEFAGVVAARGNLVQGMPLGLTVTAMPLGRCGACRSCQAGRRNLCRENISRAIGYGLPGAFAEYVRVPAAELGRNVFRLDHCDSSHGAMIEPLAVALRAVTRLEPQPGEHVLVLGLGMIGQCVSRLLDRLGAHVHGVDSSQLRCSYATRAVPTGTFGPRMESVLGDASECGVRRVDAVLDATGNADLIAEALARLRGAGRLGIVSLPSQTLDLDARRVALLELDVRGSYAYDSEFAEAHRMVEIGQVDLGDLVSSRFPLEQAEVALQAAADTHGQVKVQLQPASYAV